MERRKFEKPEFDVAGAIRDRMRGLKLNWTIWYSSNTGVVIKKLVGLMPLVLALYFEITYDS
jgi:hypothetical protein